MRIHTLFNVMLLSLTLIPSASADVELCSRKAQILAGLVSHYWIKTPKVVAGMGPADLKANERLGENRVDALFTPVYVVDHSNERPTECVKIEVPSEECVEKKLQPGRYLGRFSPFNNCFLFTLDTLRECGAHGENFERAFRESDIHSNSASLLTPSCNNVQSCISKLDELNPLVDPLSSLSDLCKESKAELKSQSLELESSTMPDPLSKLPNSIAD